MRSEKRPLAALLYFWMQRLPVLAIPLLLRHWLLNAILKRGTYKCIFHPKCYLVLCTRDLFKGTFQKLLTEFTHSWNARNYFSIIKSTSFVYRAGYLRLVIHTSCLNTPRYAQNTRCGQAKLCQCRFVFFSFWLMQGEQTSLFKWLMFLLAVITVVLSVDVSGSQRGGACSPRFCWNGLWSMTTYAITKGLVFRCCICRRCGWLTSVLWNAFLQIKLLLMVE